MADDVTQASDKAQPPPWAAGTDDRMHELDPALTEDEIALVRRYGEETTYKAGTWLWRTGERAVGLFLVLDGELDVVAQRDGAEQHIITHSAGHYAGETTSMIARGALVDGRAKTDLHVLEVSSQRLREMIALEAELGEKIFLSFILRRMRLIAEDQGDITLYGVAEEAETARVRTFLSRQGIPFAFRDLGDDGNQSRLDALGHAPQDRPVVSSDRLTLVKPSIRALAEELGIAATIKPDQTYDLVVAGGGPGGLAAAVYGASEGLSVLVVESLAPGGQAATSSRIENFFGFPTGISGQALTGRGFLQASKFGAEVASARRIETITCGAPHTLTLDGGDTVRAKSIVIASGAEYRTPPIEGLDRFTGGGVHYGASHLEAQLCKKRDIAIVGGGNSAGQAAIFLAGHARRVHILIRGESLASSMSSYLIERIEQTENIDVLPFTEVAEVCGEQSLQSLKLRDNRTDETRMADIAHLFIFIGAVPANAFLPPDVTQDKKGFVLTGTDLTADQLTAAGWELERAPGPLETSCPGIFAVGDIRSGSVKRVASAVGEGSVCVSEVHQFIAGLA